MTGNDCCRFVRALKLGVSQQQKPITVDKKRVLRVTSPWLGLKSHLASLQQTVNFKQQFYQNFSPYIRGL
jgi:hypothetical protein